MIAAPSSCSRRRVRQISDNQEIVLQRFERFKNARQLTEASSSAGFQWFHDDPVRT